MAWDRVDGNAKRNPCKQLTIECRTARSLHAFFRPWNDLLARKLASDALHERRQDGAHSHPVLVDYTKAKLTMMPFLFKALSLASAYQGEQKLCSGIRHRVFCCRCSTCCAFVYSHQNTECKSIH